MQIDLLAEEGAHLDTQWLGKAFKVAIWISFGIILGVTLTKNPTTNLLLYAYSVESIESVAPHIQLKLPTKTTTSQDWLKLTPSIHHNMSDEELLWVASFLGPRRPGDVPIPRKPKLAFMFLCRGPLPLLPLWEAFFQGHEDLFSIYVHTHPDFKLDVSLTSLFHGRQIQSKEASWGSVNLIDAERRLLANALLDFNNERFILLSESCIPLHTFPVIYDYLIHSRVAFLQSFDDPGPVGRGRYSKQMEPIITLEQWRKGSQWFEVNRKVAIEIISDVKYYPLFRMFCKPNRCYCDEHYLPTFLNMQFGSDIANRSITWVDWTRGGPHPGMFGKQDITKEFVSRIRGGECTYNGHPSDICSLFARKFSPDTLEPLLLEIMGINGTLVIEHQ